MNAYVIPGIRSQGGYRVGQFKHETFFISPEYIISKVNDYFKTDIFYPSKLTDIPHVSLGWPKGSHVLGRRDDFSFH